MRVTLRSVTYEESLGRALLFNGARIASPLFGGGAL